MKVHHLNCGTMNPLTGTIVCHVLLVETDDGLVLVDTGYGLADVAEPGRRLGPLRHLIRPALLSEETAARQVERLGYQREDVRHVVATHLDLDHIGGIADFPDAAIHTTAAEAAAMRARRLLHDRTRYRTAQFDHDPKIVEHRPDGEPWRGFAATRELTDIAPGIVLITLPGHTRGHAAVAVDAGHRWVLHAGDAFFDAGSIDGRGAPPATRLVETALAQNRGQVRDNHARLAELYGRGEPDLLVVCAHDPRLLRLAQATQ